MTAKIDEIKVSAGQARETKEENQTNNSTAKKAPAKRRGGSAGKKNGSARTVKSRKKPGSLLSSLITFVITAIIIGGGIYAWQKSEKQKSVEEISQKAQSDRMSLEDRLNSLKNSLTGAESENEDLKAQTEELASKAKLLEVAKIDYTNDELGFGFSYPASFGEVNLGTESGATGTRMLGKFTATDKIVFGGISADYVPAGTSSIPAVTDTRGFAVKRKVYYVLGPDGAEYEVKPAQTIALADGEAILVDKNSFVISPDAEGAPVDIGGNAAVYLNLNDAKYPGIAFIDTDFGVLPLQNFIAMVKSFKIIK